MGKLLARVARVSKDEGNLVKAESMEKQRVSQLLETGIPELSAIGS